MNTRQRLLHSFASPTGILAGLGVIVLIVLAIVAPSSGAKRLPPAIRN